MGAAYALVLGRGQGGEAALWGKKAAARSVPSKGPPVRAARSASAPRPSPSPRCLHSCAKVVNSIVSVGCGIRHRRALAGDNGESAFADIAKRSCLSANDHIADESISVTLPM